MTASKLAKEAGFKSLGDVAAITGESSSNLTKWHKNKPQLFRVILAGCKEIAKQNRPTGSHWFCESCGEALQEKDVKLNQHHAYCGNLAKWVKIEG
jgi:rRNA maturation endonuclease Nob1